MDQIIQVLQQIAAPKLTDWITTGVVILNLILSLILIKQYFISKKSLHDEHEKARREKAIEVLQYWHQRLSRRSSLARKLVENFTFAQSKQLLDQDQVTKIPVIFKENILSIFPDIELQGKEGIIYSANPDEICLSSEYSGLLRWEIVSYLNYLETMLSAWHHNVADQEMLEEQLTYLVSSKNNHFLLENFRQASGDGESYPSIKVFIAYLKNKSEKETLAKMKLGK